MRSYPAAPAPRQGTLSVILKPFDSGPVVAVPVALVRLLGDWTAAAFVAQCCYLSERIADAEGWFFQTHEEWQRGLDLSPDQVRRCVKSAKGIIQAKRKGIPGRNAYRVQWDVLQGELEQLHPAPPEIPKATGAETAELQPEVVPVVSQPEPPRAVARPAPRHTFIENKKHKQRDDVCKVPSASPAELQALLRAYNDHRGGLPEASGLSTARTKALTILLSDCGGDLPAAVSLLTDAAQEVAQDRFWTEKRFGIDTLIPKSLGRAEAWRARQQGNKQVPSQTQPAAVFGIGELVTYRRERYAVESVTDRSIELYDEENGSVLILRNSDDYRSIRPLQVRA